jgi:drug/metabolite transporter (DMT)-like permease
MDKDQTNGYLLILAAGFCWGTIGFFSTHLAKCGLTAEQVAFVRLLIASLLLAPIMLIRGRGIGLFRISRRGLFSCALVGLISQALFNICYMNTIEQNGMATGAVFLYTSPVYVALMSRLFFGEPLTRPKAIAILLNVAGCILAVTGGDLSEVRISAFGLVMGLLAGFTYALLPVLSRTGADNENPFSAAFYSQVFGVIFLFFMVRPYRGLEAPITPSMLALMIGFGILSSAVAYSLFYGGISRIRETSRIPVIASVETIVAALIGLAAFGQTLGSGKICGIALVLLSIAVINSKPSKKRHKDIAEVNVT